MLRLAMARLQELRAQVPEVRVEMSGKRGIAYLKFRRVVPHQAFTHLADRPAFPDLVALADRYLQEFQEGTVDQFDVVYTRFESVSRQRPVVETLLPLSGLQAEDTSVGTRAEILYDFLPSPEDILHEIVPTSFRMRLFKCFLDAAASEQIARMVAMKAATENADAMIVHLGLAYNRARQTQITSEILEVLGGSEALK